MNPGLKRSQLALGILVAAFVGSYGVLVFQNIQLKRQLKSMILAAEGRSSRGGRQPRLDAGSKAAYQIAVGESLDIAVFNSDNKSVPLKTAISASGSTVLWFFDPSCGGCEAEASRLASLYSKGTVGGAPAVAISRGTREATEEFLARHQLRIGTFYLPVVPGPGMETRFLKVPQLIEVSPDARVTKVLAGIKAIAS